MKNLKVALLAIAMLVGVGSAFAYKVVASCPQGTPYERISGSQPWVAVGVEATSQNPADFVQVVNNEYDCIDNPTTCVYYLDPIDGKFKTCLRGLFSE